MRMVRYYGYIFLLLLSLFFVEQLLDYINFHLAIDLTQMFLKYSSLVYKKKKKNEASFGNILNNNNYYYYYYKTDTLVYTKLKE